MNPDDERKLSRLLALAQEGDRAAYELFFREAVARLRPFIAHRVHSADEREDVLQETLITIHRGRHSYSPDRPVGPWMYAICEYRVVDHLRKRRRAEKLEGEWVRVRAETSSAAPPEGDRFEEVAGLLKRLPSRQKSIIELLKLRELSVSEVAARTGMSESSVKVTAFRGYETLRKLLGVKK